MIETYVARVPVQKASELLGLSVLSVQGALIHKALPIGGAWKNEGSSCYTYHISPQQLALYIGVTKEEVMEFCNSGKVKNDEG
jgi:hypothetical protein